MLPGLLWLLLPPICICHFPEKLAGTYQEPPRPEKAPENEDHAPGCPAAKKLTPHTSFEDALASSGVDVAAVPLSEVPCPSPKQFSTSGTPALPSLHILLDGFPLRL